MTYQGSTHSEKWTKKDHEMYLELQKNKKMDYKIVSSTYPEGLTSKVKELMEEGWKPIGGHSVVETHRQNRYSGSQHMDTIIKIEYTQSLIKEVKRETIEVDVAYYEDEDTNEKVYDEEGMLEEFEYKLSLIKQN